MFYHRRRNVFSSIILFMCCRNHHRLHVSLLARSYLFPRVSSSDAMINTEHGEGGKKSISVPNCIKFMQLGYVAAHYVVYIPIPNPCGGGGGGFRQGFTSEASDQNFHRIFARECIH